MAGAHAGGFRAGAAFHLKVIRVFLAQPKAAAPALPGSSGRWLMTVDEAGRPQVTPVAADAFAVSLADLPKIIADPAAQIDSAILARIGCACFDRLQSKNEGLHMTVRQLRNSK